MFLEPPFAHIESFLAAQPEAKRGELRQLHERILQALPDCQQWFDDGTDDHGKSVTNPTIGYGSQTIRYAKGKTKPFFQIGLSPGKTGISVYILGLSDKNYLPATYGNALGKAKLSSYCIRFNKLNDVDLDVLESAIKDGARLTGA